MNGQTDRTLVVLRHAKSAWPEDVPDYDRPLAPRGRRDAPAMGRWLSRAGYLPDHVICSSARRTRQTWELVRPELGVDPPTSFEPRMYGASLRELVGLVASAPAGAGTVLLIGHNPGLGDLALALAGDTRSEASNRMRDKFPTAAVAVFTASGGWDQVATSARLVEFVTPHDVQARPSR